MHTKTALRSLCLSVLLVPSFLCPSALAADTPAKIDNAQTRVLVVSTAPNVQSVLHEHKVNRVMIYLDPGQMTLTDTHGKVDTLNFKAGQALWSPATGPHISHNVTTHAVRIVEVELKPKPAPPAALKLSPLDPVTVDPRRYKVEWENDQVRVIRAHYAPHEKGVLHEHTLNRVVTYLTDGHLKVTTPDGESKILKTPAGEVTWGTHAKHLEENLSDTPFEVLVVEFKQ